MKQRAAVYVRMSTEKQDDSPERQRSLIRPYLAARDYVVVAEYEDLVKKGWDETRPGLQDLIADAGRGLFDVIVVDEWNRLSRLDLVDTVRHVVGPLQDAGVRLDTAKDGPVEWGDFAGQIKLLLHTHASAAETQTLARRTLSRLVEMAKTGSLFQGPTPYGYAAVAVAGRRVSLAPGDPEQVETVRFLFDAYVNRGLGFTALARHLTDAGRPPPGDGTGWHPSTIRDIIDSPVYAGHYRWNSESGRRHAWYADGELKASAKARGKDGARRVRNKPADQVTLPNTHVPLVGQDLWDQAQRVRAARRTGGRTSSRGVRPLTGVLHCFHCGRVMYRTVPRPGCPAKFRCAGNMRKLPGWDPCKCYQVREEDAWEWVFAFLKDTLFGDRAVAAYRQEAAKEAGRRADPKARKAVLAVVKKLEKKLKTSYDSLTVTPKHLTGPLIDIIEGLTRDLAAAKSRLAELDVDPAAEAEAAVGHLQELFDNMKAAMEKGDAGATNAVLRLLVERVDVEFVTRRTARKEWHDPVRLHVRLRDARGGLGGCVKLG
jgi:DNA invertase Pin-like site-specific DNA recombinase